MVWEPYGDNSRYWIGPEEPSTFNGDIFCIADGFRQYTPSVVRQIVGDILHLNFFEVWRQRKIK